jgi:hypothetical protein
MNHVILQFFKPAKTYPSLVNGRFPVSGLVFIFILIVVEKILQIPFTEKAAALELAERGMAEQGIDIIHNLRHLIAALGVVTDAVGILLGSFILFLILKIFRIKVKYRSAFILYAYLIIFFVLENILNMVILYGRGFDTLTNAYEVSFMGLNVFLSYEDVGKFLYSLASLANPFSVLFIAWLSIAVSSVFQTGLLKSLSASLLLFAVTKVVPLLSVLFVN